MTSFLCKAFLFVAVLAVANGCNSPQAETKDANRQQTFEGKYPIRVVVTVGMVADIIRNVGGDRVEVEQIMGTGVDPHLYKPTRDDVAKIMKSDAVFYCGLMLEGKMADTLEKVGKQRPVYAVTELIDKKKLLEPEGFDGHFDPHVWMDIEAWSGCVEAAAKSLSEFDPGNEKSYRANADAYLEQLKQLHAYGKKSLSSIPDSSRVLITSHDAFNYFGKAYGMEVTGVQGISTESEAGLQRVNELVDLIVSRKVKAVFVESSVPRKNIEAIIEGARARGHELKIGGELFSDAMGEAQTYEGTYIGMLDHNITLVTRALGGKAPERGLNNKLSH